MEDYIAKLQNFPNGAHDDQVDSASQAIVWMLKRMSHGFKPGVTSVTRSTNPWHGGERYRDPRYGDEPIVVDRSAQAQAHNVNAHRAECGRCRREFLRG